MPACEDQRERARSIDVESRHIVVQDLVNAIRVTLVVLVMPVHHRATGVDELPPALDRYRASATEYEVHAVSADADLEHGIANEASERKIAWNPVHLLAQATRYLRTRAGHSGG